MSQPLRVPFEIRPGPGGWTWRVADPAGATSEGQAPSRAVAAACVIRVLATASAPPLDRPRAAHAIRRTKP
jgi:hypothetical protein